MLFSDNPYTTGDSIGTLLKRSFTYRQSVDGRLVVIYYFYCIVYSALSAANDSLVSQRSIKVSRRKRDITH